MSDEWNFYPCQMGEHRAFIFYDEGIADSLDEVTCEDFLGLRVRFKDPRDDGLPKDEEFQQLTALEDRITEFINMAGGHYVGRVTVDGARYFHCYVTLSDQRIRTFIDATEKETGYRFDIRREADPERSGYWDELYPGEDDRQVIKDMRVLEALKRKGDDPSTERQVDHWLYFEAAENRTRFEQWAAARGYLLKGRTEPDAEHSTFGLQLTHLGTMELADITHHTIELNRAAKEIGGDYDGWETSVESGSPRKA